MLESLQCLCVRAQQNLRLCGGTSPVHNAVSVEGHEVDLTAATGTDGREKHLKNRDGFDLK